MSDAPRLPARQMLDEAASVCHLLGGLASSHLIVVGGLVPPLLVPANADLHVGSADVDFCLSMAITDGRTGSYESIQAKLEPHFEPVDAGGFRWRKREDEAGLPLLLDFLAPSDDTTPLADGTLEMANATAQSNMGSALRPFPLRAGALIDRDADTFVQRGVRLTYRPGVRANVTIRHAGPVGFLAAKGDALAGRDDPKDGYDIAWWCLNAADSPAAAAQIVIDREAFANPLFAESVHQIQSAFEEADFPGPSGYASELHTDLGPGDHIYDLARNEAFARVKPFAAALRERLWR